MNPSHFLRPVVVSIAVWLIASIGGAQAAEPAGAPPAAETGAAAHGPRLTIAQPVHDAGTVSQGDVIRLAFEIANSGDETLEITDVHTSCGCTTTGEWTRTLKPGEKGTIPVSLETAQFVGPLAKSITVVSNDRTRPEQILEMKATVWTPIRLSTSVLVFPATTNPNEATSRSVTIHNELDAPLTISDVQSENPLFTVELKEMVPGKDFELLVTTVPPLPAGSKTGRIRMKSSQAKMPELSLQAVVTVLPAVQIAPAEIMLSSRRLAAAEKRFAIVMNHRGADLQVSDIATNAPGVEIATNASTDHKQFTITLTFPAGFEMKPGEKLFLRGKTSHPAAAEFQIPIVWAGEQ